MKPSPELISSWSWQLFGRPPHVVPSRHGELSEHAVTPSPHTPVWHWPLPSPVPPLFRQSIAEMQSVSVDVLLPLFAHAALQLAKIAEYSGVAEQSAIPLLTMQFNAAAVSWRAS